MERVKTKKKLLTAGKAKLFVVILINRVVKVRGKRRAVLSKSAPKRKKPSKSITKSKNKKAAAKPSVEELLHKVCTGSHVLRIVINLVTR